MAVEGWFASLDAEGVEVRFDDVRTLSAGRDGTTVGAIVRHAAVCPEGKELRALENRPTRVLQTSGHVLRIVREHTSLSVGFDDMKAIFLRDGAA